VRIADAYPRAPLSAVKASSKYALIGGPFGSKLGGGDYVEEGIPVIRGANLRTEARFSFEDFVFVTEEKALDLRSNLAFPGDVVVTQRGTLGQVGFIPKSSPYDRFVISQSQMKLTVDSAKADPLFVYYALRSPLGQHEIQSRAITAGVPHINLSLFQQLQIPLPALKIQHKIASILSAYDDLIENNTRRIQILEAMAQAIYREWFVEFRFPGHEGTRMVDSALGPIPEGWKILRLGDVVDVNARVIRGGNDLQDINYIDISAVAQGEFGWTNMEYAVAPGRARRLVASCDVMWSTVRPNLRAYALICEPPSNCVASTGFAVLTARAVPWSYLFAVVTTDAFVSYLVNHATGSAYPAVTGRTFEQAPLIVPDENSVAAFHRVVGPMHQLVAKLRSMSRNLRQTRDLLLPRLISGEIDVSDLDLGGAEPAA